MPKISASVHKTIKKLDAAIAIVSPKRGTNAAVVLANQLKQVLQAGRPFDIKWGESARRVNPEFIRIHKSTVTFVLDDQDFDLQLSAIDYIAAGQQDNGEPRFVPGFSDENEGISFQLAEIEISDKGRKAA